MKKIGQKHIINLFGDFQLLFFIVLFIILTTYNSNSQQDPKDFQNFSSSDTIFPPRYKVKAMGNSIGLNSSDISALFQDKNGFIWVGTQLGISRFNGYESENFTKAEKTFLGRIQSITEDNTGTLWVGGINGLFYFQNGQFHSTSIAKKDIQVVHFDNKNEAWIGGLGFIPFVLSSSDLLQLKNGGDVQTNPIVNQRVWKEKIGQPSAWDIDTDNQGITWLGLRNRRASFDRNQLTVHWKDSSATARNKYSLVATFDTDNVFWGSEGLGLILQKQNQFKKITQSATYISAKTDSSIYFLTPGELLEFKNGELNTLHTFSAHKNLYFKKMIIDREGNFWIGAEGNLLKLTPNQFKTWSFSDHPKLDSNHSIAQLSNGKILIGSNKENVLTFKSDRPVQYTNIDVPHNSSTRAIYQDQNNWIWYGTSMGGLILDKNGRKETYTEKDGLGNKGQYFFYKDRNGKLWSGGEVGITLININKQKKLHFDNFMVKHEGEEPPLFRTIFESPDNTIWSVSNKGLFILKNKQLEQWAFPTPLTPYPVITNSVIDVDGQLWLSTMGEGLWQCRFNENNEPVLIREWSVKDGLLSNVILDVLIDKSNRIWIAGQNGISSLSYKEKNHPIVSYNQADGWLGDPTPHCKLMESDNGLLWAVGLTQISAFPLYHLVKNEIEPYTFITQIKLFDGKEDIYTYSQNIKNNRALPEELVLPYNKNFLSFYFTTTSYAQLNKNSFIYKLEGLDSKWNNPISDNKVLYSGLQPGEFTFKALGINNDGILGNKEASFSFKILSPWWATWWAYLLYITFFCAIAYSFYRFQLSKKLGIEEERRLKEIDQLKTSLYTNITHEFRTPLTVILGMTDQLKSSVEDLSLHSATRPLEMIRRNGENLLKLVNQMLEVAKLKSGNLELKLINSDVIPFVKYLCESFHSYAQDKHINLVVYGEIDQLMMDFDSKKLDTIISNLLSNAIKFSTSGEKIIVHLNQAFVNNKQSFIIKVRDTGEGISANNLSNIFERFYQVDNSSTRLSAGSGIGLAQTKELVELMDGTITVKSTMGKGSEFTVQIPITNKAINAECIPRPSKPKVAISSATPETYHEIHEKDEEVPLVLLIEDNADVSHYLITCLQENYRILNSRNGKQGVEIALKVLPDIIISDVMMPLMDGFEVCSTLKEDTRTSHIPIILLTAKATFEDRITGLEQGADAYLVKPFEKAELMIRLDRLLEIRKRLQKKYSSALVSSQNDGKGVMNKEESFLWKVENIILEHLDDENFSGNELARSLLLSRSQVHRKLKALTGMSTAIYIRFIRLQQANELLQEEAVLSISEIAFKVGFTSPVYFSQIYKKTFGRSPSATRK